MKIKITDKLKIDAKIAAFILVIIAAGAYLLFFSQEDDANLPSMELTQCIGSKSTIYISTGCVACASQERLFGDNFKYLNIIDCMIFSDKCEKANITRVPTWVIGELTMNGVQQIDELKRLTQCS